MQPMCRRTLLLVAGPLVATAVFADSIGNERIDQRQIKSYWTKEFAFSYPAGFQVSAEGSAVAIHVTSPSRSPYWEDTVTIRKHNRKTEECDIPQSSTPDRGKKREIAGRIAYGYSGEDAATNRYVREKGYLMETQTSCWRFELVRKERPYQKSNLPSEEVRRLDRQSNQDSDKAKAAFNM